MENHTHSKIHTNQDALEIGDRQEPVIHGDDLAILDFLPRGKEQAPEWA